LDEETRFYLKQAGCESFEECSHIDNQLINSLVYSLNLIILVIAILGNGIILILTLKHRNKSRIRATVYIVNIVIIDLILTCIYIPIKINENTMTWFYSSLLCKTVQCGNFMLLSSNVNIAASLSICRWEVTRKNHFHAYIKPLDQFYIIIIWFFSITSSISTGFVTDLSIHETNSSNPQVFCGKTLHNISNNSHGELELLYQIYVSLIHFAIPVIIISVSYICYMRNRSKGNVTQKSGEINRLGVFFRRLPGPRCSYGRKPYMPGLPEITG